MGKMGKQIDVKLPNLLGILIKEEVYIIVFLNIQVIKKNKVYPFQNILHYIYIYMYKWISKSRFKIKTWYFG